MNSDHIARRRGAPPAGRRLTRDAVITRATELVERAGAAAFSLRSLAKDLDVRPAALYNHIDGLDDLLDSVAGRFVAGFDLTAADDEPWPVWLRAVATRLHRQMLAQPELTALVLARAPATAAGPAFMRRFLDLSVAAGVSLPVAHLAWHTVLTVVIGSVQQERARDKDQSDTFDAVLTATVTGLLAAANGPPDERLVALLADHTPQHRTSATPAPGDRDRS